MMEPMLSSPISTTSSNITTDQQHHDQHHANTTTYKVYRERWYALTIFSILEMANALLWVTFSPISDITQHYFGSSTYYGSTTGVNMMANIFLILYTPGTIISVLSMKYFKPRKALLAAGLLTAIGALLRYLAVLFDNTLSQEQVYVLIFLGQCLSAIAQPMFLNFPPAIASIWFPVDERDISTTIGSMSSPIGNAIGSVIPVLFVTESQKSGTVGDDDSNFTIKGMQELMLVEFLLCMVPLVIAFFYFKDAPPTPPSHSTQLKLEQQEHAHSHSHHHNTHNNDGRPSDRSLHTLPPSDDLHHNENLIVGGEGSIANSSASTSRHDAAQVLSEASSSLTNSATNSDGHHANSISYESFSHTVSAKLEYGNVTPSPNAYHNHHSNLNNTHSNTLHTTTNTHSNPLHRSTSNSTQNTTTGSTSNNNEEWESLKRDCWLLLTNKDYIILFFAFSIGVGFFNSIMTLLNQIVGPFGYSNDDAGTFGAVFIFCGLAGAGVAGHYMEKTKAYRTMLKGGIVTCCLMVCLFLAMLFSNNFWPLTVSMGLMGFFILPLLPIMMENCAECTYPVQEELSMGILFTGCNVLGLAFIFALQYLLEEKPVGPPPFLPSNFFIIGILAVAAIALLFYKGEYKRLQHEGEDAQLDDMDPTNPLHGGEHSNKSSNSANSNNKFIRRSTKGSEDVNLVRVGSNDGSSSNNSQIFNQSASAAAHSTSVNIWNVSRQPTAAIMTTVGNANM